MRKKLKEYRAELKELSEQRADLETQMKELLKKAKEEKRAFSENEELQFNELERSIKAIDKTIEAEKRALVLTQDKKVEPEKGKVEDLTKEEIRTQEQAEEKAFANFIRGKAQEIRAGEIQLTQGANGAIIPVSIANKIIVAVKDMVPFLTLSDVINTTGKLSVPVYGEDATNYINADYVEEGTALTDNVGKFITVDLTGYVIGALALVSNKLITNSDIDIVNFIVNQVARALAEKLEKEFTVGTSNKITGVLSAKTSITAASATAITYDELINLKHSIKQQFRKNAVWIMNDTTYTAICKLKDNDGRPYFKDDDYMLLNNRVIVTDSMPEIAQSAKVIVFADLSGYTIKGAKAVEVTVLRERYAEKNMIGVMAYAEYDAKITDEKKLAVLSMASA